MYSDFHNYICTNTQYSEDRGVATSSLVSFSINTLQIGIAMLSSSFINFLRMQSSHVKFVHTNGEYRAQLQYEVLPLSTTGGVKRDESITYTNGGISTL